MNEQHNHHCRLTFRGFDWWITCCRNDRIDVARPFGRSGKIVIIATIDTRQVDWSAYCEAAEAWDRAS